MLARLRRRRAWKLLLAADLLGGATIVVGGLVSDFFATTLGVVLVACGAVLVVGALAYAYR
jgi:hypothetical protein